VSSEVRRIAATLLHDVGKYVARTARNVPAGAPIAGAFASMMLRDVYETWRGARASARFDDLAAELRGALDHDPRLSRARERLASIDALEPRARSGDAAALAEIAALARGVEDDLRSLAKDLAKDT
jgi:hypothetical protein